MNAWKVKHAAMREEWKARIVDCRQSKIPVREWCQIHGVSPKTYYRWEREIVGLAGEEMAGSQGNSLALPDPKTEFAMVPTQRRVKAQSPGEVIATFRKGELALDLYGGVSAEMVKVLLEGMTHAQ